MTRTLLCVVLGCGAWAAAGAQTVDQPLRVGGEVTAPVRVPQPNIATTPATEVVERGTATLSFILDEQGRVLRVRVLQTAGSRALDGKAIRTLHGYRYTPAMRAGVPVAVVLSEQVSVELAAGEQAERPFRLREPGGMTPPVVLVQTDVQFRPPANPPCPMQTASHIALIVDEQGRPTKLRVAVSSPVDEFDAAALKAVEGYRFKPARKDGQPVEAAMTIIVPYACY